MPNRSVSPIAVFLFIILLFLVISTSGKNSTQQLPAQQSLGSFDTTTRVIPEIGLGIEFGEALIPLTTEIDSDTEWVLVKIDGPPENTWAKFLLIGGTTEVIGYCTQRDVARPPEGSIYEAGVNNIFSPKEGVFQLFQIEKQVMSSSTQSTAIPTTDTSVNQTQPTSQEVISLGTPVTTVQRDDPSNNFSGWWVCGAWFLAICFLVLMFRTSNSEN